MSVLGECLSLGEHTQIISDSKDEVEN